jgi:hypothetical protein
MALAPKQSFSKKNIKLENKPRDHSRSESSNSSKSSYSSNDSKTLYYSKSSKKEKGFNIEGLLKNSGIDPKKNTKPIVNIQAYNLKTQLSNINSNLNANSSIKPGNNLLC